MSIIDSIQLSGVTYQIQGEITVDVALDSGSTNPVANSAITTALDDKVNVVDNEVPQFTTQGDMLTRYYPASGTPETVFANMPVKMKVSTSGNDPRRIDDIIYINDENGFVASGNCSGSRGQMTPSIPSELQPYLTVRGLYEGMNNLFEAKEGYRISYVDATMTDGDGKFEPGITPYFLVYEGGQSADVIKDVIEPALINKQDTLVSGTNIKTVNNQSLLGSGNINIQGGSVDVDSALSPTSENPVQNKVIYNKIDEVEQVTAAGLNALNSKITPTVELTQAQYDALVSAGTVSADTYYIITDAQAGDLTNYYTKSETNTLLGGKQPTLISGTNIKTINNESILGSGNIDIQGGSTYTAGRGISIANDTISLDLPIYKTVSGTAYSLVLNAYSEPSANTFKTKYNTYINCNNPYVDNSSGTKNLIMGEACSAMSYAYDSFVGGINSKIGDMRTFAFGSRSEALAMGAVAFGNDGQSFKPQVSKGYGSFACGGGTSANTQYSFATGYHTFTTRRSEFASGQYNNSVSATTTFGDSGNTLFSVGNGTADNARHNAFEIRQNGDIYLTKDGQDVKLQDQLGGSSITVDTALDSGSTNPVENRVIYNKIDEVEQVTAAALNELNDNFGGLKLVKLTQTEYNALATKDASTLYIIVN